MIIADGVVLDWTAIKVYDGLDTDECDCFQCELIKVMNKMRDWGETSPTIIIEFVPNG